MKIKFIVILAVLFGSICVPKVFALSKKTPFYEIKVYHFENANQEELIDDYLKNAFLPAMNRKGKMNVGVFKPVNNNSSEDKRIYVLVPFKSTKQFTDMPEQLAKDAMYNENGKAYLDVAYNKAPYKRMESIFIKAFSNMPNMELPALKNELSKRIY